MSSILMFFQWSAKAAEDKGSTLPLESGVKTEPNAPTTKPDSTKGPTSPLQPEPIQPKSDPCLACGLG